MKKDLTEAVFIIDRSGSMSGLEDDTVGGFNSMLEQMKQEHEDVIVSTVFFNQTSRVVHDRIDIQHVAPLTRKDYMPAGSTALLDAAGGSIHHIGALHHKLAQKGKQPAHTVFVIITDGYENASRKYDYDRVHQMIELEKKRYGWEFLFLGADVDAAKTAERFGISADRSADYHNDEAGVRLNYQVVGEAVCSIGRSEKLSSHWKDRIDADYSGRRQ